MVDTLGLLLAVVVHPADIQDLDGAKLVLSKLLGLFPRLKLVWADSAYAGQLVDWAYAMGGWMIEVVKRAPHSHSFEVLPRRWVVERTLGWLGRNRRLSKDYEELTESSEAWVHIAMIHLMLKRLRPTRIYFEHRLLETAQETPYYPLFYTALYTGMRRGELLALQWDEVDLDMATLSVTRSVYRRSGGEFVISQPKTPKSRRMIALPPSLALVLMEHRARRENQVALLGIPLTHLAFSHHDGSPLDPSTVSHTFGKVIKMAGLPPIRFHDLRHTHAPLMLKQGVHPKIVSERLGHSTVAMTLDTYSHVVPGLQEQAGSGLMKG